MNGGCMEWINAELRVNRCTVKGLRNNSGLSWNDCVQHKSSVASSRAADGGFRGLKSIHRRHSQNLKICFGLQYIFLEILAHGARVTKQVTKHRHTISQNMPLCDGFFWLAMKGPRMKTPELSEKQVKYYKKIILQKLWRNFTTSCNIAPIRATNVKNIICLFKLLIWTTD